MHCCYFETRFTPWLLQRTLHKHTHILSSTRTVTRVTHVHWSDDNFTRTSTYAAPMIVVRNVDYTLIERMGADAIPAKIGAALSSWGL